MTQDKLYQPWQQQIKQLWQPSFIPDVSQIQQSFIGLDPKNIRIVFLSDRPKNNCPTAFYDTNAENFDDDKINSSTQYLARMILFQNRLNDMTEFPPVSEFFNKMKQFGVLFLNTSLSAGYQDSDLQRKYHSQLWKPFIKNVIADILKERDCIFICFGSDAKKFMNHIQFNTIFYKRQSKIILCTHPGMFTKEAIEAQQQENVFRQIKNAEIDLGYETRIDFLKLKLIDI